MEAISRRFARLTGAIGWIGGLGCALLVSALVLVFVHLLPAREQARLLDRDIQRLENQFRSAPSSVISDTTLREQMEAFLASLPRQDAINSQLNGLHEIAARHQLTLKTGDYRTAAAKGGKIHRLQIAVKTQASYADVRRFLRDVRSALPAWSLNRISMTRQRLSDATLETAVEFVLFYAGTES